MSCTPEPSEGATRSELVSGTLPPMPKGGPASDVPSPERIFLSRVLTKSDLSAASALFENAPGWESYAAAFRSDAERCLNSSQSVVIGIFRGEVLVAVGMIDKERFDFAYWSVTWVMVDTAMRRSGLGRMVMEALIEHAKLKQADSHNPNCRILLSAVDDAAASFYENLGFTSLMRGPLPGGEQLMAKDVCGPGLPLRNAPSPSTPA